MLATVSHEANENVEVYFDDLTVTRLNVQENHFDPWGQNLVGIEQAGSPDYKFQYNGIEKHEDFGLNVNMAKYRTLDPQLGRWWQVDPEIEQLESQTPYNSNINNPVRFYDPDGDIPPLVVIGFMIAAYMLDASTAEAPRSNVNENTLKIDAKNRQSLDNTTTAITIVANPTSLLKQPAKKSLVILAAKAANANRKVAAANAKASTPTSRRVEPRNATKEKVKENQPKNEQGQMLDPHTFEPLDPDKMDLGHKTGQEWRTRKKMHEEKGSTRKEVIEAENDPNIYHYEDRSNNRSHKYEKKN